MRKVLLIGNMLKLIAKNMLLTHAKVKPSQLESKTEKIEKRMEKISNKSIHTHPFTDTFTNFVGTYAQKPVKEIETEITTKTYNYRILKYKIAFSAELESRFLSAHSVFLRFYSGIESVTVIFFKTVEFKI
jgi:hypothetical protein